MKIQNKKIEVYLQEKNKINIQNYSLKKDLNKFIIKYLEFTFLVLIIVFSILYYLL